MRIIKIKLIVYTKKEKLMKMRKTEKLADLKLELKLKSKNGIDFIFSATIIWLGIFLIWSLLTNSPYEKSVFTFIFVSLLLPLAFGLSKIFKTNWKIKDNPLQPLGLWLNLAQLFYFPFLIFIMIKYPDYFIMAYAVIAGAHLFPYAWFYEEAGYAIFAAIISVASMLIALTINASDIYYIPLLASVSFLLLGLWLNFKHRKLKSKMLHNKPS